jgi:hypothetical protein
MLTKTMPNWEMLGEYQEGRLMIQIISIVISPGSFILSFFQPMWAWVPLIVTTILLLAVLMSFKSPIGDQEIPRL